MSACQGTKRQYLNPGKVEDASKKEDVMEIFDIFSGKKGLINAIPYCFTLDCLITRESTTIVNKL